MDNEIWVSDDELLWCVNDNYLWIPRFENGREVFVLKFIDYCFDSENIDYSFNFENIDYCFDSENIDYQFIYIDPSYENNYTI